VYSYVIAVKVTAKDGRRSIVSTTARKSTTTARKSTTTKSKKGAIIAKVAKARTANLAKGAKGFYTDKGANALAIACERASTLPTMKSRKVTTANTREMARARREFALAINAPIVDALAIIHANKKGAISHDRPENVVRARLASIAKVTGVHYYAIRVSEYREGEIVKVAIVRK